MHVKPAGTLTFTPASGSPVFSFAGTSAQEIDVQGTFTPSSNSVININNPAGVNLTTSLALAGNLTFTSGNINTGARTLSLGAASSVTGAAQGTGWVNGNLSKTYPAGVFSSTLAVGDAATYAPVGITGTGAGAGFALTARTFGNEHPNIATSGLDAARSLNRYWSVASANGAGATWTATYNYATADLDGTADPLTFAARTWDGLAWTTQPVNAATSNSIQLAGLTSATPTQFAFGNVPSFVITASAGANGTIAPSGSVSVLAGANQAFTITANAGYGIQDVLVDAASVGAVGTFNFTNVTANHTIAASFVDITAPSVTVTAPNGGEILTIGTGTSLTWTATDNAAVTSVDIELSRAGAGGPFESIATGLANTGSFSWTVTGPVTANALLRVTAKDAANLSTQDLSDAVFQIAGGAGVNDGPVTEFALSRVTPNPVRHSTQFTFALPREANIRLSVHDVQGRERLLLANGGFAPGRHSIDWTSQGATQLDPGLYFVRLQVPGRTITQRFVLMK